MSRLLIINADDLGWSEPVTRGIVDCHLRGVVTSASLMTTLPGAMDAVERLRDCPDLGVGVHLSLTAGIPVSTDPAVRRALAPEGEFPSSLPRLLMASRTSKAWRTAAFVELMAQVQWVLDQGLVPDHLDAHKHFHVVPPFAELVARIARLHGMRAIRSTVERGLSCCLPVGGNLRRRALSFWGKRARAVFDDASLVSPGELFGIVHTGSRSPAPIGDFLRSSGASSVEWMVHPGDVEACSAVRTRLVRSRPAEKKLLTDPDLRAIISGSGFTLARYGDLIQ